MVLAELNAFVSRPIAPTRRIALGELNLPCLPAPGMGGLLLGGIVARFAMFLDDDSQVDLAKLIGQIEHGQRIPQPRLRHRFQIDHVGLQRLSYRLTSFGERLCFEIDSERATPAQHVLLAVYAAGTLDPHPRSAVIRTLRRALSFPGGSDEDLIRFLTGHSRGGAHAISDPVLWALEVLDLAAFDDLVAVDHQSPNTSDASGDDDPPLQLPPALPTLPTRSQIQRAFRTQLRRSHPDHGGERIGAAQRIADLAEARRILLDR